MEPAKLSPSTANREILVIPSMKVYRSDWSGINNRNELEKNEFLVVTKNSARMCAKNLFSRLYT